MAAPLRLRRLACRQAPLGSVTGALGIGSDVAQSGIEDKKASGLSQKAIGALTIGGLFLLLTAVASGIGAAIGFLGLIVLVVGIVAVVRGGAAWARIVSRRAAVAVAVAGFLAMAIGGALSPTPKTENTAAEVSAPTSSAAPTTAAPKSTTAAPKPLVAAPATTTSAAPVLPPAPVMAMTCPAGGSVASPAYGQQISATAPYTVTITYGDGDAYTNDDQHLAAIFSHTYKVSGNFTVDAVLTDATGRTASASCLYAWTKPVVVASTGGGSSSGSGASAGGGSSSNGDTYTNVDGDEVQAPVQAPSAPDGASAQCQDGSWSFSQHRSGTCSGHGGVAQWLG